jgi:hypothetical protein
MPNTKLGRFHIKLVISLLKHISELEVFEWLTEKDRQLQKLNWLNLYVDVYPVDKDARINLNTACKKLLSSLFSDCKNCVADVLKERDSGVKEVATGFMQKGFKEAKNIYELASFKNYYKDETPKDSNSDKTNATSGSNASNSGNKWKKENLGVMTKYLDVYIRVQRTGTESVFDMKSRFLVETEKPSVEIQLRNFSPVQPITLANQRVCIE